MAVPVRKKVQDVPRRKNPLAAPPAPKKTASTTKATPAKTPAKTPARSTKQPHPGQGPTWSHFSRWDGTERLPGVSFNKAGKRKVDGITMDVFVVSVHPMDGARVDEGIPKIEILIGKEGKKVRVFKLNGEAKELT